MAVFNTDKKSTDKKEKFTPMPELEVKKEVKTSFKAKVINGTLNVRSEPSFNGKILKKLTDGTIIMLEEDKNGWSKLATEEGYVKTEFTQKI